MMYHVTTSRMHDENGGSRLTWESYCNSAWQKGDLAYYNYTYI
jgi:hypothetical protein